MINEILNLLKCLVHSVSFLCSIKWEKTDSKNKQVSNVTEIRPLFVYYLFQLHRPHQDIATASYCNYTHYGVIIGVNFSYRVVQNNFNLLVTCLESFQAITIIFVFCYSNWKSLLCSMTP